MKPRHRRLAIAGGVVCAVGVAAALAFGGRIAIQGRADEVLAAAAA